MPVVGAHVCAGAVCHCRFNHYLTLACRGGDPQECYLPRSIIKLLWRLEAQEKARAKTEFELVYPIQTQLGVYNHQCVLIEQSPLDRLHFEWLGIGQLDAN